MKLYDKLNKEKQMLEKLLQRREELNIKIQQSNEKIKIIEEDIENLEMKTTVKVIKSRGYSISDVREAITSGVLDDVLKKE
jgi:molecular chaperone GrpE (heat shock protein)